MRALICLSLMVLPLGELAAKKILVMPLLSYQDRVAPEITKEMAEAIVEEFKASSDFFTIKGAYVAVKSASGRRAVRDTRDIKQALKTFAAAQKDTKRLRHQDAIPKLEKAIRSFRANLGDFDDYDKLVEAHLLLAECYFRRGKQSQGYDALVNVARIRPKMVLQSERYPPMFTSAYERAKRQIAGRGRGALEIQGDSGLRVSVNGKSVGTIPLRVENLSAGEHHVQIADANGVFAGHFIDVKSEQTAKKRYNKRPAGKSVAAGTKSNPLSQEIKNNRFGSRTRSLALELARQNNAEYVWLGVMAPSKAVFELGSVLGRVSDNRWIRLQNLSPDVDLLSSGIESNNLVVEVTDKIRSMAKPLTNSALMPLLEGRPIEGGGSAPPTVAKYEEPSFQPARTSVPKPGPITSRGDEGRRPVGAARRGIVPKRSSSSTKGASDLTLDDVTIGTFEKPEAAGDVPERVVREDGSLEINVPREERGKGIAVPSSTLSGQEENERRGPVLNYSESRIGLEKNQEIRAYDGGGMSPIDLDVQLDSYQSSVFTSWWFWSAMSASAALIGGGTWYLMNSAQNPDSVRIQAEW